MRTPTDALRSLKKYLSVALGPEWELRLTGEEGAFARPFARVGAATGFRARPHGPLLMDLTQPFSVVCHPVEKATPDEAALEAALTQQKLVRAFLVGAHTPAYRVVGGYVRGGQATTVRRGHPMRVPLYDYDGIGVAGAALETDRDRTDWLRITGEPTIDVIPDPNDDLRFAVAAAVTMSWSTSAAVLSDGMIVTNVPITAEGDS